MSIALGSSPEWGNAVVTSFILKGFGVKFFHDGGGFDCSRKGELYCNLWIKAMKEPLQQGMIVSDSRVDREEGEWGDVFVKFQGVLLVLVKQGEGNSSLHCCIIGSECGLEGFLDLGPGLVYVCDVVIFELGKPSLSKGFSLSFGHSIEENYGLCFIRVLVCMKGTIGLHGLEPSVGISSFSTELYREGSFDFHYVFVIIFFVSEEIYVIGE